MKITKKSNFWQKSTEVIFEFRDLVLDFEKLNTTKVGWCSGYQRRGKHHSFAVNCFFFGLMFCYNAPDLEWQIKRGLSFSFFKFI